jgi:hypothetical protein
MPIVFGQVSAARNHVDVVRRSQVPSILVVCHAEES